MVLMVSEAAVHSLLTHCLGTCRTAAACGGEQEAEEKEQVPSSPPRGLAHRADFWHWA